MTVRSGPESRASSRTAGGPLKPVVAAVARRARWACVLAGLGIGAITGRSHAQSTQVPPPRAVSWVRARLAAVTLPAAAPGAEIASLDFVILGDAPPPSPATPNTRVVPLARDACARFRLLHQ